jgi:hypothetical protein
MKFKISAQMFPIALFVFGLPVGIWAAPLPFGDNPMTGISIFTEPSLAGSILEDIFTPYSGGMVESRVVRSTLNGTLDFYWRILPDTVGIGGLRMAWSAGVIQDANWRSDDLGNVAPGTARNFDIRPGAAVNFLFSDPGVGPTDSSRFFFVRTDATAYDRSGFYDLLDTSGFLISSQFATFAPVPEPSVLGLGSLALMGVLTRGFFKKQSQRRCDHAA